MREKLIFAVAIMMLVLPMANAQQVITAAGSYDIDYLTPKKYEIGGITVDGADKLDSRTILLVSGLKVGDEILVPGDKLSSAIDKLWKQEIFDDVKIEASRIQDNLIFLNIKLSQRPRLSKFQFKGVKKSDVDKIREEIKIVVGDVVTENLITTSSNLIRAHYIQKGYHNVEVNVLTVPDTTKEREEVILVFDVNKHSKVKIKSIEFEGNKTLSANDLQKEMKNTHDVNYWKKMYFWTSGFWKKSKYIESDYKTDLESIVEKYNELGYRDAKIVSDSVYTNPDGSLGIKLKVYEGNRYYFRNITFAGNTVYPSSQLAKLMRIEKGQPYNKKMLEQNVSMEPTGTDNINSLYMDNGYLAFRAMPTEIAVENDSIDIEVRMREGEQYRINKVMLEGNTVTNDKIIMRELYTRPGDLYSKDLVMRSLRELATMQFFKQESLVPDIQPSDNGTVDITYKFEEQSTSQISLSGGWGGAGMVIGTVGLSFNNFSVRNLFNKKAWNPLPSGDGQQLSISAQSNGTFYYSVNAAFTEPWLGGKKPQALSVNIYHSLWSNGYTYDETAEEYYSMKITGGGVSLAKRLTWPDNYFIFSQGLVFRRYTVKNYTTFVFPDGNSNDLNYNATLSRNSFDSPIYPLSGSEVSVNMQATPPYSLFNAKDYAGLSDQDKYRWLEYYKINIKGSWMFNLAGNLVLNTRFRFGLMGHYNKDIGLSPFGRYYLGGDGLSTWSLDARDVIALRGYNTHALTPTDASGNYTGAAVYDKFTLELRQALTNSSAATIYALGFLEAGNSWLSLSQFQPFRMYTSAGLGVRIYMPAFGLIGVDWGYGFDDKTNGGSHFHFSINQSIE